VDAVGSGSGDHARALVGLPDTLPGVDAQQESSKRPRRLVPAILAGLATALVLAGCGAGQNTQTDATEPDVNGNLAQLGPIAVRDAKFANPGARSYTSGSTATLILTIVNTGATDDELVGVTSPVSDDIEITGDKSIPGRTSLVVGTPGQANPPTQSSVVTTTPTATSGSSSATAPPPASSTAPAVERGKAMVVLKQLKMDLMPGLTYEVTFQFRNAGTLRMQLPIADPTTPRAEPTGTAGNG
jgi:copper(I)-binding protein